MRKNLILGLFLASVLLMSVIGISAQITGDIIINKPAGGCPPGCRPHLADQCLCKTEIIDPSSDNIASSKSSTTDTSSAKRGSDVFRGWTKVKADDGSDCYVKEKGKTTGRFLGFMFRK